MKLLALLILALPAHPSAPSSALTWLPWSNAVFEQAEREHRFVLLDLEAVWCHWCHVMDETTYKDPAVIALLRSKYVLIRVDQDSRPDLSNRYEDYGWPATVVFDAARHEIVKRQGYIPPRAMASMLKAIVDDPTPGPSIKAEAPLDLAASPFLTEAARQQLRKAYLAQYDSKNGAWGFVQKYLDWDSTEYAMWLAWQGDAGAAQMARQTLTAQLNLLDPAWGGVYQYSTDGDWKHPHFEKIMAMQAENLRIYAEGWRQFHDPAYLRAAQEIHRFLTSFLLSPEGAFYTSQNADLVDGEHSAHYFSLGDRARRKLGVPRVDKHIYARENGWAIAALAELAGATGQELYADEARRAAKWVLQNRALPGGGFRHGDGDIGVYLGDSLAMARAFLALYDATAGREWLQRSMAAVRFIDVSFADPSGAGYLTAKPAPGQAFAPRPERDENAVLARTANMLFRYTGDKFYSKVASRAMRYVANPQIAKAFPAATALLTDSRLTGQPLHLTIVAHKDDASGLALFRAAVQSAPAYKLVEWWDKREGPLPNPEIQYPELKRAAAFICTERSCSAPVFDAAQLQAKIARFHFSK